MANLQHGYTFTEHAIRDPANFNKLVDSASLNNVKNADLAAGNALPTLATRNSPITGETNVRSDYLLEYYYSGAWNQQPADVLYLTLQNNSAVNLTIGNVVVPDMSSAGGFVIPTIMNDPKTKALGVLLDDINAGSSGRVAYRGSVIVQLNNIVLPQSAGKLITLIDHTGFPAYSQLVATTGTMDSGNGDDTVFGILLQDGIGNTAYAYIWK